MLKHRRAAKEIVDDVIEDEKRKGYICISKTQDDLFDFTDDYSLTFAESAEGRGKYLVEECSYPEEVEILLNYYHGAGYEVHHHTMSCTPDGFFRAVYVFIKSVK